MCYIGNKKHNHRFELTCCTCHQKSRPCFQTLGAADGDEDPCLVLSDSDYEADHATDCMQIYVKNNGAAQRFFVRSETTVYDLKALISLKLHIPMNIFFLSFAGKLLSDDDKSLSDYAIVRDSQIMLDIRGFGGGKRAKTSTGARRTTHDKDTRLTELRDAIGSTVMKIRAKNGMSDALLGIADTLMTHEGVIEQSPNDVVTASMGALNRLALRALQSQLMNTNNVDHRMMLIMKLFYKQQLMTLNELRNLIDETEQSLLTITELAMVHQFCKDDEGTMSWSDVNTILVDVLEGKAVRAGANLVAGAAPAAAPAMEI
jgi:hypothetical protein